MFSKLKESEKKKAFKAENRGIRTKEPGSILTFNLLENKYNTIMLDFWEIVNFLTITPDNIEILDKVVNDMLKKPIERDLSEKPDKSYKKNDQ